MKYLILIIALFTTLLVFSQNKIVVPDSVLSYKVKPISLYLNEQPKGFFNNNERALHSYSIPFFSSVNYNSVRVKSQYNRASYNRLNPYHNSDPLGAVLEGSLNYLFNKALYHK